MKCFPLEVILGIVCRGKIGVFIQASTYLWWREAEFAYFAKSGKGFVAELCSFFLRFCMLDLDKPVEQGVSLTVPYNTLPALSG